MLYTRTCITNKSTQTAPCSKLLGFFCEFGGGSSSGGDETFIYFHQLLKYHWLILYGNMTAKGYFIIFTSLLFMRIFCLYGS